PRLLNRDSSLQEAGGVIGSDAQTRSLGDGRSSKDLEYRFRRAVDYGSAACMLVERSAFLEAGGFDSVYGIGYFEDVDLCFELSRRGFVIVYEPRSTVVHVRAASSSLLEAKRPIAQN